MTDYGHRGKSAPTEQYPRGRSKGLHVLDLDGKKPEQVDVSAQDGEGGAQQYKCNVADCGRIFKTAAIASNHFRGSHKDLAVEKDSWRAYVDEV